jgi:hypothetical protein
MVSKPYICENDKTTKGWEFASVLGELNSVLGYQKLWSAICCLELGSAFFF